MCYQDDKTECLMNEVIETYLYLFLCKTIVGFQSTPYVLVYSIFVFCLIIVVICTCRSQN